MEYILIGVNIYFKAKDAAKMLGYSNTIKAIATHVDNDFKIKLSDIHKYYKAGEAEMGFVRRESSENSIFLTESGLYQLIFKSNMPRAKWFSKWVAQEVLPSIRTTGSYTLNKSVDRYCIRNERALHYKVIAFIKKHFKEAVIITSLGELQKTEELRLESFSKGYRAGQPDIIILNLHKSYSGMAIELKTPTGMGILSDKQISFLETLKNNNYYTLVSNDYDEVVLEITKYLLDVLFLCTCCRKRFKSQHTLDIHIKKFHTQVNNDVNDIIEESY
jgi:prophage antirepressor-like protein